MSIRRVVPDLHTHDLERSRDFYCDVLGFEVAMDMGWVSIVASPDNPTAQVLLVRDERTAPVEPDMTVEVEDVDAVHDRAIAQGHEIVHPLTTEEWGVRRFFVRDPDGTIVNVMTHVG